MIYYRMNILSSIFSVIVILVVLYLVLMIITWLFSTIGSSTLEDAKKQRTVKTQKGDTNYTISVWFYVNDWSYRYGSKKVILSRSGQSPEIALGATENELSVSVACYAIAKSQHEGFTGTTTTTKSTTASSTSPSSSINPLTSGAVGSSSTVVDSKGAGVLSTRTKQIAAGQSGTTSAPVGGAGILPSTDAHSSLSDQAAFNKHQVTAAQGAPEKTYIPLHKPLSAASSKTHAASTISTATKTTATTSGHQAVQKAAASGHTAPVDHPSPSLTATSSLHPAVPANQHPSVPGASHSAGAASAPGSTLSTVSGGFSGGHSTAHTPLGTHATVHPASSHSPTTHSGLPLHTAAHPAHAATSHISPPHIASHPTAPHLTHASVQSPLHHVTPHHITPHQVYIPPNQKGASGPTAGEHGSAVASLAHAKAEARGISGGDHSTKSGFNSQSHGANTSSHTHTHRSALENTVASPSGGSIHTCTISNCPLQAWVNVVVSVYGHTLDIYIDGKLMKSCTMPGIAVPSSSGEAIVTPDGGFDGHTGRIDYWSSASNAEQAYMIYLSGGGGSTSQKDSYNVRVSFLENGHEEGSFSI